MEIGFGDVGDVGAGDSVVETEEIVGIGKNPVQKGVFVGEVGQVGRRRQAGERKINSVAEGAQRRKNADVVVFFEWVEVLKFERVGEGAADEGDFHKSLSKFFSVFSHVQFLKTFFLPCFPNFL